MENTRLSKQVGAGNYYCTSFVVFFYELFGTFCLIGSILCTKGSAAAIGLSLFFLTLLCGPITGGHFNPSVTIGVWLNKIRVTDRGQSITLQAAIMIIAQLIGAHLSVLVFISILGDQNNDGVINKQDFPHLVPTTQNWMQAEFIEMFVTFIFVTSVLLVKDASASKFSSSVGPDAVNFFGCGIIALTFAGMVMFAGPHTGASINPAVSMALNVVWSEIFAEPDHQGFFWGVYMMGPLLGAIIAGVLSWIHAMALDSHGPAAPAKAAPAEEEEQQKLLDEENY